MGGQGSKSEQPKIPKALKPLYELAYNQLLGAANDKSWFQGDPNIAPTAADLAAQQQAMQTFGGADFAGIKDMVKGMAMTGGWEDFSPYARAVQKREFDVGSADIGEYFSKMGMSRSSGTANALGNFRGDLGNKLALSLFENKQRSYDRSLGAAQLYGGLGQMGIGSLMAAGGNLRGIQEANYNRAYQDFMAQKQWPLAIAGAAFGGASGAPLWQPTYGPGTGANVLAGAATGAGIGTSVYPGWGTLAGAAIGAGAAWYANR